jgi:hypothetical protein
LRISVNAAGNAESKAQRNQHFLHDHERRFGLRVFHERSCRLGGVVMGMVAGALVMGVTMSEGRR